MLTRFVAAVGLLGGLAIAGAVEPLHAQTPPGPVIVSELMWPGSDASSADEWIELYNRSPEAVDLSGWTITRGDGEDEAVMIVIETALIRPGEVFLISNYDADDDRSHLARRPDLVDAAVSLPNSRLRLRLYSGDPTLASVVDEVDDGTGAPFAGSGGDGKAAMVRVALEMSGTNADAWSSATESDGWDTGAPELGTPGTIPGQLQPAATSATQVSAAPWARIKGARR